MEETLQRYKTYFLNQGFSEKSWHEYERNLIQLVGWLGDNKVDSLDSVTPEVLVKYGDFLRETTTIHRGTPISEKFYLQKIVCIRGLFKYLIEEEGYSSNPALIAFPDLTPKHEETAGFLTSEQLDEIIDNVSDPMELAVVYTLVSTGIRASEIIECNLDSLDLDNKELKITGKEGVERCSELSDNDVEILRHYLLWRNPRAKDVALFVSKRGLRLTYNQLHYIFSKIGKKTSIHLHPHLFRHTFAASMLEEGKDLKQVQELLGHRRLDITTSIYKSDIPTSTLQIEPSESSENGSDKVAKGKRRKKLA